jgi:serine/threonine protein kinase
MDLAFLCMGCMENKGSASLCPYCGWVEASGPVSALHLNPGTIVNQKYLLGKALGQGGFGITYLGWDLYLDRKLAVKEYFPREMSYREVGMTAVSLHSTGQESQFNYGLEKFLSEAKTLAIFEGHPNIVTVRDFFKENNTAYLVMNYIKGIAFSDYLSHKGGVIPFEEAIRIMMPMLDALRAVHENNLLHRDISPDNIFVTSEGRVILLDFGAARHALGEQGRNLSVILKPGYAPEEQYRSRGKQGPWTDIYAAAATIYKATTGKMPPDALDRLSDDPIVRPSLLGASISIEEEAVVMKAMAVKAENRYQSVSEFQNSIWVATSAHKGRVTTGQQEVAINIDSCTEAQISFPADEITESKIPGIQQYQVESVNPRPVSQIGTVITIGREMGNDLILADSTVSRSHARLYFNEGRWYISDLGSTHGTYLNEQKVTTDTEVHKDAIIRFSQTEIFFDGAGLYAKDGKLLANLESHPCQSRYIFSVSAGNSLIYNLFKNKNAIIALTALIVVILFSLIFLLFSGKDRGYISGPAVVENQPEAVEPVSSDIADTEVIETGTISYLGGTYTGELKNGLPHGKGVLVYGQEQTSMGIVKRSERKYEGEWQEGMMHGKGILTYPDGSVKSGTWENDTYLGR